MTCICCGESAWQVATTLPRFIFGVSARIEKCAICGFGRTVPTPSTYFSHYEQAGDSIDNFQNRAEDYRLFARELLADAPIKSGRLLDIGCGGGFLVEEAGKLGFDAHGVEANLTLVNRCQARGLSVSNADVSELNPIDKFDLIVISALLEHLENPSKLIKSAHKMLTDEGSLLISQASFDGLLPRIAPWGWYGWQPKEHFWHFTPESFRKFAGRNGFDCTIIRRSLHHFWYSSGKNILRNPLTVVARIGSRLNGGDSFNAVMRPRINLPADLGAHIASS